MKIEVERNPSGNYTVRLIDESGTQRYDDSLSFDEALGCVASFLCKQEPRYLRTEAEWKEYGIKFPGVLDYRKPGHHLSMSPKEE